MTKPVNSLNLLMAPLPEEAIERSDGRRTGKGYDTTGYGYQYVVNRLNQVLGIAGWSESYKIEREFEGVWGKDKKPFHEIAVSCRIEFTDPDTGKQSHREACGWHKANAWGDALKGAQTNALKKTASKIGPGWQAYADAVDDDNQPAEEGDSEDPRPPSAREIQEEARQVKPTEEIDRDQVMRRIGELRSDLGAGEFSRVVGCQPAEAEKWKPRTVGEANTKLAALERALSVRIARESKEATA